jgi:hypothetical protein
VDELHFMIGAGVVGEGVRAFENRPPNVSVKQPWKLGHLSCAT